VSGVSKKPENLNRKDGTFHVIKLLCDPTGNSNGKFIIEVLYVYHP
jgi:hypothetical protein